MTVAGLKPRVFLRIGTWSAAVLIASAITACGGGGGGSSGGSGGNPLPPLNTPTSSPVPTGTPTVSPSISVTTALPSGGANVSVPAINGYIGSVSFAGPMTGAGANVTITASTVPASGIPTLQSIARKPKSVSGAPGLLYLSVLSDGSLTFTGYPTFSFVLPASVAITSGQLFYVALYSSDQPTLGYAGPIAGSTIGTNASGQHTLTFSSAFNQGFAIAKGTTYEFVVFTIATALPTPTPTNSPTATPIATATPTLAPTATPTATTPTPTPSPATSTAPAPTIGYLATSGTNSFSGHLGNSSNIWIVGVGTTFVNTNHSSNLSTASITQTNSAVGALGVHRAARSGNPFWLASAWSEHPLHGDAHIEDPAAMRQLQSQLHRVPNGRVTQAIRRAKGLSGVVGATAGVWTQNASINGGSGTYKQIPSTLQLVTDHGYIWVDNSLVALTPSQVTQIGADFENAYASDTAHYGGSAYTSAAPGNQTTYTTCDTNGTSDGGSSPNYIVPTDDKIAVEVLDPVNIGTGVGGYFASLNHVPQSIVNCFNKTSGNLRSNESAMFYVAYYGPNAAPNGSSDNYELNEDLVRGTAHEFQHLINFVHHSLLQSNPATIGAPGPAEQSWINEGLSMLSQDFAVTRLNPSLPNDVDDALGYANRYLANPQNYSLTGFTGKDTSSVKYNCSGCYGASYLFQRYLYDRLGGDAYLSTSLNSTKIGQSGVEAAAGQSLASLLGDFGIALVASNTNITTDPRFRFTTFNPRGTYTDQFGQAFTLTGPTSIRDIAPGVTNALAPYQGSLFFMHGAGSSNTNVTVLDVGGSFGLSVGVVQQ